MLFVLTGDIQTGKTRWLLALVEKLAERGVEAAGVVAPGVWRDWRDAAPVQRSLHVDANGFEKLGIDNVLLPHGERVPFARRRDLARDSRCGQSEAAGLGWAIDDGAIACVNAHFRDLAATPPTKAELLVVDELGRLELERGGGLVDAVRLLDAGPRCPRCHALVVVRETLRGKLEGRFASWGEQVDVFPDAASAQAVVRAFAQSGDDAL